MSKEFAPYELAVKLKALKFDELCVGYYHVFDGYPEGYAFGYFNEPKRYESDSAVLSPTFSQAFRWFREKYELYSTIMFRVSMEDNNEYWDWLIKGEEVVYRHFKTYEEAELACLIKLIEIVEQQNQK